jgi:hypothetical protein
METIRQYTPENMVISNYNVINVPLKELESQPMRRERTLMFLQILCNQEKNS